MPARNVLIGLGGFGERVVVAVAEQSAARGAAPPHALVITGDDAAGLAIRRHPPRDEPAPPQLAPAADGAARADPDPAPPEGRLGSGPTWEQVVGRFEPLTPGAAEVCSEAQAGLQPGDRLRVLLVADLAEATTGRLLLPAAGWIRGVLEQLAVPTAEVSAIAAAYLRPAAPAGERAGLYAAFKEIASALRQPGAAPFSRASAAGWPFDRFVLLERNRLDGSAAGSQEQVEATAYSLLVALSSGAPQADLILSYPLPTAFSQQGSYFSSAGAVTLEYPLRATVEAAAHRLAAEFIRAELLAGESGSKPDPAQVRLPNVAAVGDALKAASARLDPESLVVTLLRAVPAGLDADAQAEGRPIPVRAHLAELSFEHVALDKEPDAVANYDAWVVSALLPRWVGQIQANAQTHEAALERQHSAELDRLLGEPTSYPGGLRSARAYVDGLEAALDKRQRELASVSADAGQAETQLEGALAEFRLATRRLPILPPLVARLFLLWVLASYALAGLSSAAGWFGGPLGTLAGSTAVAGAMALGTWLWWRNRHLEYTRARTTALRALARKHGALLRRAALASLARLYEGLKLWPEPQRGALGALAAKLGRVAGALEAGAGAPSSRYGISVVDPATFEKLYRAGAPTPDVLVQPALGARKLLAGWRDFQDEAAPAGLVAEGQTCLPTLRNRTLDDLLRERATVPDLSPLLDAAGPLEVLEALNRRAIPLARHQHPAVPILAQDAYLLTEQVDGGFFPAQLAGDIQRRFDIASFTQVQTGDRTLATYCCLVHGLLPDGLITLARSYAADYLNLAEAERAALHLDPDFVGLPELNVAKSSTSTRAGRASAKGRQQ